MLLKTILNRVERHKRFVYGKASWFNHARPSLRIEVRPRAGSDPFCSGCGKRGPTYDHLKVRLFEFVPLWQVIVFFAYALRRVDCKRCGVTVEMVPWAEGKCSLTNSYRWFLAGWVKRLSWKEVSEVFGTTWQNVPVGRDGCRVG